MGSRNDMGKDVGDLVGGFAGALDSIGIMLVIIVITIPLAIWKLIEIIIWLCHFFGRHWVS